MRRHAGAICFLLFSLPMAAMAAMAASRGDKLLREYVTKLARALALVNKTSAP